MPFWRPAAGSEQFKPINRYPALKDDRSIPPECSWGGFKDVTPIFAPVRLGRERWTSGLILPRHRHEQGYICVVLSGGFEEAGDCGRRIVRAGDVNCHE